MSTSSSSSSGSDSDIPDCFKSPPAPQNIPLPLLTTPPSPLTPFHILILGGNGCIGSEITNLIKTQLQFINLQPIHLTLLNRGRQYWSESSNTNLTPSTTSHLHLDRTNKQHLQQALTQHYPNKSVEIVIDCSAYRRKSIQDVLECISVTSQYIYISSDSIYEVCIPSLSSSPTVEHECQRPTNEKDKKSLNDNDKYGHKKKQCEELLIHLCQQNRVPSCTILRCADVIGPKDNTDRLWHYVLWLRYCHSHHIHPGLHKNKKNQRLSFTYSKDVASLITCFVSQNEAMKKSGVKCYNLACSETLTHAELVVEIGKCMGITAFSSTTDLNVSPSLSYYPSTERGPVNVDAVMNECQEFWQPTSVLVAIQESVTFLEQALRQGWNVKDRNEVICSLAADLELVRSKDRKKLLKGLIETYGPDIKYLWKRKKKKKKQNKDE